MSIFATLKGQAAILALAAELGIDATALEQRWRRTAARLVDGGMSQTDADAQAFRDVAEESRDRRTTIDRFHGGKRRATR